MKPELWVRWYETAEDGEHSARPKSQTLVLVVDDNEDIREAMRAALEGAGYAVKGASDGAEALALLRQEGLRPA